MRQRLISAFVATVLLALGIVLPVSAANSARADTACAVPVELVHGFGEAPRTWQEGARSMLKAISQVKGVQLAEPFDYEKHNYSWVTNENIGPALARQILSLSDANRACGGNGKIILVGHSMGVLAIRQAASMTIDGRKVADAIGYIVGIGGPNLGAGSANFIGVPLASVICGIQTPSSIFSIIRSPSAVQKCMNGSATAAMAWNSPQLRALPPFPDGVPVHQLAGLVSAFGSFSIGPPGDEVVSVESALSGSTWMNRGDGREIFKCTFLEGSCNHWKQLNSPVFQGAVVRGIEAYLASIPSIDPTPEPADTSPTPKSSWTPPPTSDDGTPLPSPTPSR